MCSDAYRAKLRARAERVHEQTDRAITQLVDERSALLVSEWRRRYDKHTLRIHGGMGAISVDAGPFVVNFVQSDECRAHCESEKVVRWLSTRDVPFLSLIRDYLDDVDDMTQGKAHAFVDVDVRR